jgi:hypothetical protein
MKHVAGGVPIGEWKLRFMVSVLACGEVSRPFYFMVFMVLVLAYGEASRVIDFHGVYVVLQQSESRSAPLSATLQSPNTGQAQKPLATEEAVNSRLWLHPR